MANSECDNCGGTHFGSYGCPFTELEGRKWKMSWSLSNRGSKADVKKYLDEQAPTAIAHVQGVERAIADQALGLARAVVEGNTNPDYEVSVSANGSASFTSTGQDGQHVMLDVSFMRKGS